MNTRPWTLNNDCGNFLPTRRTAASCQPHSVCYTKTCIYISADSVRRATIGGAVVPCGNAVINVHDEMKQFERKHPSMARTLIRPPPPLQRKLKQIIAPSAAQHHQFQGGYVAPSPFQDTLPIEAMRDVVRAVNKLARSMNRDCIMDDVSPDAMEVRL